MYDVRTAIYIVSPLQSQNTVFIIALDLCVKNVGWLRRGSLSGTAQNGNSTWHSFFLERGRPGSIPPPCPVLSSLLFLARVPVSFAIPDPSGSQSLGTPCIAPPRPLHLDGNLRISFRNQLTAVSSLCPPERTCRFRCSCLGSLFLLPYTSPGQTSLLLCQTIRIGNPSLR